MFLQILFISLSMVLTLLFFLYGFNHYFLLYSARRYIAPNLGAGSQPRSAVCIHLPIYNEKYVIHRLIAACSKMAKAYGIDKVRIIIIDDSEDDSIHVVDEVVKEYQGKGYKVEILRRNNRQGFKAGALQAALKITEEDFIVVFDADFIPAEDFLSRTIPYFLSDDNLGIIQSRWTHTNRNYNSLTKAIAIGIDVHFLIEQTGRYASGCLQNFNGSGGVLRKKALLEAGGWQSDTLAEDLDVSYRIQLRDYRFLYINDLQSPGEIPPTVPSFKKQQGRWANGSLRTARKILPTILSNRKLGLKKRLEAIIHLTGYMVHPLMLISFVLTLMATMLSVNSFRIAHLNTIMEYANQPQSMSFNGTFVLETLTWVLLGSMILFCSIAAWVTPIASLKAQNLPISRNLWSLLILFLLGFGISMSNTIEAGKALLTNRDWVFKRTPKYAVESGREEWRSRRYQVPLDLTAIMELLLVLLGGIAMAYAISRSNFVVLLILVPYTLAYAFVLAMTVWQSQQEKAG
jgi:cellulose synthase/poly-beta-1,6-N-acetylglucosamine synthase-like glycosyltransferase